MREDLARGFHVSPQGIDNLLVRIHFIIVMIRWTGLAPWEFESPFPGSLTSTFLDLARGFHVSPQGQRKEFLIDNLLVRIHFIIVMIRWTGRKVILVH